MRKQKGQAIVEFAMVLPLFLLLVFGIIYMGLLYTDYLTLSNLARESARAASIQGAASHEAIREAGGHQVFLTDLYTWQVNEATFQIIPDDVNSKVTVILTKDLNHDFPGVGFLANQGMMPEHLIVQYSMYNEFTETSP